MARRKESNRWIVFDIIEGIFDIIMLCFGFVYRGVTGVFGLIFRIFD